MSLDATVNAGDIARMADVGRAAVSNWRRRYDDFPEPVGGTTSSPLFSLPEVEAWLRRNNKTFEVSVADRVWQRLRTSADDLHLGDLLGQAGAFLLYTLREPDGLRRLAGGPGLPARLAEAVAAATPDLPVRPGAPGHADGRAEIWAEDAGLIGPLGELAAAHGPAEAFELLCERYVEAHSRRLSITRTDVAELMARLACSEGGSVLDPACGMGTLLLAVKEARRGRSDAAPPGGEPVDEPVAPGSPSLPGQEPRPRSQDPTLPGPGAMSPGEAVHETHETHESRKAPRAPELLGQDSGETVALLATLRLLLRGEHARVVAGDSLRDDGFPGALADAVVCDPPFNERAWGHEDLVGDPRWTYGMPPRGESELAWAQHCLAHVRPGGLVAVLMPAAAASRRSGRRIRANMLRAGAVRAVFSLGAGGPDLWLLRRPEPGERQPVTVLVATAGDDLTLVESAWAAHLTGAEPPGESRTVGIVDLLDDEVDLSPARHLSPRGDAGDFPAARDRFRDASAALVAVAAGSLGDLDAPGDAAGWDSPPATLAELVRAGLVTVRHSTLKAADEDGPDEGALPVLTAEDLARGGPPTGTAAPEDGLVTIADGDVVGSAMTARVIGSGGAVLGPQLTLFRVDPTRIDPEFLAGFLRFATAGRPHLGSSRVDARRARVPRLSLAEQSRYGQAFRRLLDLEDGLREAAAAGEALVRLGVEGLAAGHLRPGS
ncbi:N-6 DNA methylase [Planotetraspora phitsanulokensis]|uniref:SAM-dependent methyltransferase n=1 Tax=Planotetraspora phitsanulokensis TaxID=575192 RepID=A0A8J3U5Q6_9ACTN|nr:N-6 DNA methylase [Planotetraspora phitsanulokensis]GII38710.1 SAM-dependent methyltransferase [Planotetraspora phitsanulokensis]